MAPDKNEQRTVDIDLLKSLKEAKGNPPEGDIDMSPDNNEQKDGDSLLTQSEQEELLFNIEQYTNNDGTVDVKIKDLELGEEQSTWNEWANKSTVEAEVEFQFPNGETDTEVMDMPRSSHATRSFPLLVKSLGYKMSQAEQIKGHMVKYNPQTDQLDPDVPLKLKLKKIYNKLKLRERWTESEQEQRKAKANVLTLLFLANIGIAVITEAITVGWSSAVFIISSIIIVVVMEYLV